jgi:hypothetical protein
MDIQTSHQLLDKIAEVKSAENSLLRDSLGPDQIASIEGDAKREAIKNILQVGVIGAGGAIGFRGVQGLWNLLTRTSADQSSRAGVATLPVPYPVEEEEEEELRKVAQDPVKTSPHDYAKWYWPGLLAAAMGGTYGGWKLSDSFFDDRRQDEVEDELESAKEDFQEALTSHYGTPDDKLAAEKTAARKLGEELDDLFLRIERATTYKKSAGDPISDAAKLISGAVQAPGKVVETVTSPGFKNKAMGLYGVYAIPTILAGYLAAKHISDKHSQRKILEKAMHSRAAKNYAKRPSELYAYPDPQVYASSDEDEEE